MSLADPPPYPPGSLADRAVGPLGVPMPAYAGRSLPNITSSVLLATGRPLPDGAVPPLERSLDPFRGRPADGPVVVFLVDGLGYRRLERSARRRDGGRARRWLEHARPITSVFPTTTTVATVSLSTATAPSRHGLVGYRQYFPRFGTVVDVLRQSPIGVPHEDALVGPGWRPSDVLGVPTIFDGGQTRAVAVSRDRFEGKGFTRLLFDGAEYAPYAAYGDFASRLASVLARPTPPPLIYAYWDELDTTSHLQGPGSDAVDLEIDRLVDLLGFVGREVGTGLAQRTTLIVTADHGQVPLEPGRQTAFDAEPEILSLLARPPTGDRRVGLLKARSGAVDRLAAAVTDRLGPGTTVLRADAAIEGGLFGPPPYHPELSERVGDLVVLVPSPGGITYLPPGAPPMRRRLLGGHGGLEEDEFFVPLVTGSLSELGTADR